MKKYFTNKRLKSIFQVLGCPACHSGLELFPTIVSNMNIKDGNLVCNKCDKLVGIMKDWQFDFIHFLKNSKLDEKIPSSKVRYLDDFAQRQTINHDDPRIRYSGDWEVFENGKYMFSDGGSGIECAELTAKCTGFEVKLLHHPWSGYLDIEIDGTLTDTYDLWDQDNHTVKKIIIAEGLPFADHTIKLIPLGHKNDKSQANQVIFKGINLLTNTKEPLEYTQVPCNEGGKFPDFFYELVAEVPRNGLILDCGGGFRQLNDPRYINFEFTQSDPPDVFGDSHYLPFKDNSFDLVLSQAVIEHLKDPFCAVREIHRVTKPRGIVYADMAFMQPLHGVPYHFFNTTHWGAQELFKDFEIIDTGWFGNLSTTLNWFFRDLKLEEKLDEHKFNTLQNILLECDSVLKHDELKSIASGVYIHCQKH